MPETFPTVQELELLLQHIERLRPRDVALEIEGTARRRLDVIADILGGLERQRDVLSRERDELLGHARRLKAEAEEAVDRGAALEQERDRLKEELNALRRDRAERGRLLWQPPGHYYSPIVDPADPAVVALAEAWPARLAERCVVPELDEAAMEVLFLQLAEFYPDMAFPEGPTAGSRFYFENPTFSYADATTLHCMLRLLKPRRLIEIGVGFSSCMTMDTNDRYLDGSIDTLFVDPYPDLLLSRLSPADPYRNRIRVSTLQEISLDLFDSLTAGDILFLDSSHVSKRGSDVNWAFFHVLPRLPVGVVVHVHDVAYPFDYSPEWTSPEENRSWNEAYLLRAFLAFNSSFQVIFFNDFFYNKRRHLTEQHMPCCLRNTGGSVWLRRVA